MTESYSHMNNMQLADDENIESLPEIDVLVGADFYWHIISVNAV